jgi:hypothetical protein
MEIYVQHMFLGEMASNLSTSFSTPTSISPFVPWRTMHFQKDLSLTKKKTFLKPAPGVGRLSLFRRYKYITIFIPSLRLSLVSTDSSSASQGDSTYISQPSGVICNTSPCDAMIEGSTHVHQQNIKGDHAETT